MRPARISVVDVVPEISGRHLQQVAELLACINPNKQREAEHRRAKLATFPELDRPIVRDIANRVIRARADQNIKALNPQTAQKE